MKFHLIYQSTSNNAHSPVRVIEQTTGQEVGWINHYLDREYVRRLGERTLRTYAHNLLHFVRWWESVHHTGHIVEQDLTESTLLDYVRLQSNKEPRPSGSTINDRVAVVDRALRNEFPNAPSQIAPGFHQVFLRRRPMGLGRPRVVMSRLRVKAPKRHIVPLSVDEVARFWSSFRNTRDLAIVGLMLLQGLRSAEVLALIATMSCFPKHKFVFAAKAINFASSHWRRKRFSCSMITCDWNGPILVALRYRLAEETRAWKAHDTGRLTFFVPLPSRHHRLPAGQSASLSAHLCLRYGAGRCQSARTYAVDGSCRYRNHAALRAGHSTRGVRSVHTCGSATYPPSSGDFIVNRVRTPSPAAAAYSGARIRSGVDSLCAALHPDTTRRYRGTAHNFLRYLGAHYPKVDSLDQLRRDTHVLGWMSLASAATCDSLVHQPPHRFALHLPRTGLDPAAFCTGQSDPAGGYSTSPAKTPAAARSTAGSAPAK
jgi:hypothetical protein